MVVKGICVGEVELGVFVTRVTKDGRDLFEAVLNGENHLVIGKDGQNIGGGDAEESLVRAGVQAQPRLRNPLYSPVPCPKHILAEVTIPQVHDARGGVLVVLFGGETKTLNEGVGKSEGSLS